MGGICAAWAQMVLWAGLAWQSIVQLVGSHLFESGLVALAGAYFGAKTAQGTAARNKFRDDMTKEIRDTNAAITLSFAVCSSAMAMKRQHLRSLKETFDHDESALLEYERKRKTGEIQGNVRYEQRFDLRFLQVPNPPTDKLQSHVLDRLSVVGRPLNLAVSISESAAALREYTANRNDQIKSFRADKEPRDRAFMARYFGFPHDGEQDEILATTINAMVLHADCVIYFTYLLCSDLKEHGDELLVKYKRRLGAREAPGITEVDFSPARTDNMIPPDSEFASWHTAFVKRPKRLSLGQRIFRVLRIKRAETSAQQKST